MVRKLDIEDSEFFKPRIRWTVILSSIGVVVIGANLAYLLQSTGGSTAGLFAIGSDVVDAIKSSTQQSPETSINPTETIPKIKSITALGRLEPQGETVELAPPQNLNGARVIELRVKEGDLVEENQVVAVLENRDLQDAAVKLAEHDIKIAQANLEIIKAGAKSGEIESQKATIQRLQAQLEGERISYQAKIARLEEQLRGEKATQEARIDRLSAELNNAQSEFERFKLLVEEGAISRLDLERRHLTLETATERVREAKANLDKTIATINQEIREVKANSQQSENTVDQQIQEAKANLDRITEVRQVDVYKAEAEIQRAKAALQQEKQQLELTYVRSPMNSRVLQIHTYPGESVQPGEGIVAIGKTDKMMVTAEVYESDIGQVKPGQTVTIESENGAFSGELQGTVSEVGWLINRQGVFNSDPASDVDNRVVEVKIQIAEQDRAKVAHLTYSRVIVKIIL
ncbi:HlyD family efflux transporter periplasmic adaptor subunit [Capilliphycus salinus ALCB114379]|uniref:HlyD family efflux transporter periplasmic adaptor subunit n=1 Tax=Capilliphycus salinus TaxID=2768948 RepID=UPI0039A6A7BA